MNETWELDAVAIELAHDYAAELELSLTSPGEEVFYLLKLNGYRTRLGDGSGTLAGAEDYAFVESGAALGSVTNWSFIGDKPEGTYDALEWPSGVLQPGEWTIALRNVNVSGLGDGVVGSVTLEGQVIPEPQTAPFALATTGILLAWRRWKRQRRASRCSL